MTKKTKRSAKSATKGASGLPEWVTKTPKETDYCLTMIDRDGEEADGVDLTREEYIALKANLAKLRGIHVPKAA